MIFLNGTPTTPLDLFDHGLSYGIMGLVIWALWRLLEKKDKEIARLNTEVKDVNKNYNENHERMIEVLILVKERIKQTEP